jgi:hypothetical protein
MYQFIGYHLSYSDVIQQLLRVRGGGSLKRANV